MNRHKSAIIFFLIILLLCILLILSRYYVSGLTKGGVDMFVDNLPGFPDNIRLSSTGGYWVAMSAVRLNPGFSMMDFLADKPWIKKMVFKVCIEGYNDYLLNVYCEHIQIGDPQCCKAIMLTSKPPYCPLQECPINILISITSYSKHVGLIFRCFRVNSKVFHLHLRQMIFR